MSKQDQAAVARNNYTALERIEAAAYYKSSDYFGIRIAIAQKDIELNSWSDQLKDLITADGAYATALELSSMIDLSKSIGVFKSIKLHSYVLSEQCRLVLHLQELCRVVEHRSKR